MNFLFDRVEKGNESTEIDEIFVRIDLYVPLILGGTHLFRKHIPFTGIVFHIRVFYKECLYELSR